MTHKLLLGNCLEVMPTLDADSIDAIVTDPPYGLSFMGKDWDHGIPGEHFWKESLRVAKPGAHLLAFGGTRTFHRLSCAIEDAGWEIRDCVMWVYGSGFPKSLDVSKAIDKAAGAERKIVGYRDRYHDGKQRKNLGAVGNMLGNNSNGVADITAPATDAAKQWQGWGTALKPAWEPIIVARKPIVGTVAENVSKYGTGAINIDGCRVEFENGEQSGSAARRKSTFGGREGEIAKESESRGQINRRGNVEAWHAERPSEQLGRWPANLIHDGSDEVVELFPVTNGSFTANHKTEEVDGCNGGDTGSAARFFYCAKASRAEREAGLSDLPIEHHTCRPQSDDENERTIQERLHGRKARNYHPTVKPLALMRYLCRLVTQPGGTILDPFCGSGSTGVACKMEGFNFIGIDNETAYLEIAKRRIEADVVESREEREVKKEATDFPLFEA